jgi:DNA repair protein RecN (Recombination protein N)
MIRFLSIQHLAIIDSLELEFGPGFTVLTGETGAGKSILMEAIGLLLGGRAAADLVRTGADTALVQAVLDTADGRELLIRREVSAQGRSRAFIDGTLATTALLRETVGTLVDLHGQHEHQGLLLPDTQLDLLDQFADASTGATSSTTAASSPASANATSANAPSGSAPKKGSAKPASAARAADLRATVATQFQELARLRDALRDLRTRDRDREARIDLLSFQRGEIDKVAPRAGEDDELAAQRTVVANADKLNRLCTEGYAALYEDDHAILGSLNAVWKRVAELAQLDPTFQPYLDRRDAVQTELEELAFALRDYASSIDASPDRLQQIEDRLAQIERLKRRYGPTLAEVLERRASIDTELQTLDTSADRAADLERQLAEARDAYLASARALSLVRRDAAGRLARALEQQLEELAMPSTRCEARLTSLEQSDDQWTEAGLDRVELYLSPNPGEELRPLARIASGGELSRVMLAIKTLASPDVPGKTLIFDEVDAGIGGRVADVVGSRLHALAGKCQVFCITHLPQVAAYGQTHFLVSKQTVNDRTVTQVEALKNDRRVEEIARMMGGRAITPSVLAGAEDMLRSRLQTTEAKGESEARGRKRKS